MITNILIVNQNIDEAKSIKTRLASSDTNAVCAHSVEEAFEAFNKSEFSLVILDSALSASDDYKILKAMRAANDADSRFIVSCRSQREDTRFSSGSTRLYGQTLVHRICRDGTTMQTIKIN